LFGLSLGKQIGAKGMMGGRVKVPGSRAKPGSPVLVSVVCRSLSDLIYKTTNRYTNPHDPHSFGVLAPAARIHKTLRI
jgi:hypothetical protein